MFSKNKNAMTLRGDAAVPTVIATDMHIVGNLVSEGAIEVAGRVEGNIKCGELNLRPTGFIKGDIFGKSVKINGEIHGVVKAKQVSVAEKGKIHGFVIYETLAIAAGAVIFGQMKQSDREDLSEEVASLTPVKEVASGRKIRLVNKSDH